MPGAASEGAVSLADMQQACDQLELLLARATTLHRKMESTKPDGVIAKKVVAWSRGWDGYSTFLEGVEAAVVGVDKTPAKGLPEPARKGKRKG